MLLSRVTRVLEIVMPKPVSALEPKLVLFKTALRNGKFDVAEPLKEQMIGLIANHEVSWTDVVTAFGDGWTVTLTDKDRTTFEDTELDSCRGMMDKNSIKSVIRSWFDSPSMGGVQFLFDVDEFRAFLESLIAKVRAKRKLLPRGADLNRAAKKDLDHAVLLCLNGVHLAVVNFGSWKIVGTMTACNSAAIGMHVGSTAI